MIVQILYISLFLTDDERDDALNVDDEFSEDEVDEVHDDDLSANATVGQIVKKLVELGKPSRSFSFLLIPSFFL